MPELPEVEDVRLRLADALVGRPIVSVLVVDGGLVRPNLSTKPSSALAEGPELLAAWKGQAVADVGRHGKRMMLRVGQQDWLHHLGMTGKWVRGERPKYARLGLELDGEWLWFADLRRFGCFTLAGSDAELADGHGPDLLLSPVSGEELAERMRTRAAIKVALMDQKRIAGLGNIHAAEALYRAGIAPTRASSSLDSAEWSRLAEAIAMQLRETVDALAAEEVVYVSEGGANPFTVYKKEGTNCPRCATLIEVFKQGGRSTFWCPGCQD